MGFDIYGLASKDKKGEYFRNNAWWWRPVAGLIEKTCNNFLTTEQRDGLHDNSGTKYDEETANKIADILEACVNSGQDKPIAKQEQIDLQISSEETHSRFLINALKSGNLDGYNNLKKAEQNKDDGGEFGYPYDQKNVKDFIKFCRKSGGFEIC